MAAKLDNMSNVIGLPSVLDIVAAPELLDSFLQRRGSPLSVDAGGVQRLGAQCLQICLAARAAWASDDITLEFKNPSEDFLASLELLGISIDRLAYHAEGKNGENDR